MWNITGQKKAVALLRRSLETGNVSHAYLFTGPEHSGKMTLAVELAKAVNCTGDDPPCGQCESCHKITGLKHADVQIIGLVPAADSEDSKAKTEISIDQIRQLQHSASLPPFEGRYKVYIIENAEMMSTEAANSLLKTLEEPERGVIFILLASDAGLLLETVISRCQPIEMVPVPVPEIERALVSEYGIHQEEAALLARLSRGWFGWAVNAARNDGVIDNRTEILDRIIELTGTDCEDRFAWSTQLAGKFSGDRHYVFERLDMWLDWWRDILIAKSGMIDKVTNIDRHEEIRQAAGKRSLVAIRNYIRSIQAAGEQLRQNANPRLVLEVLMLDMPDEESEQEANASDLR